MEKSIFGYILRYSAPQQLYLALVTVAYYPFLYMSLELPKLIVNEAIGGSPEPPHHLPLFGYTLTSQAGQIQLLLALSFAYLFLVLVNGGFKYHVNVYKGRLGERLLRRLRYQLYSRMLRFPLPRFRKLGQGEIIPVITGEVEPLGGFVGTAFADPMFYGGQLLVILGFILVQDPLLGAAAIAFYPLQMVLIPRLQRRVNRLAKERVRNVRRLADHIGESVSGIVEVHANDTAALELSRFSERLGRIYDIRYEIYRRKFFIKFLNNFIDKLTPFFFFSIGGYLVIAGELTIGALIAVLAAYKDLASPWKEVLSWYQQKEDARVKYEQVIELFSPPGMLDPALIEADPPDDRPLEGEIVAHVELADEDGVRLLDGLALTLPARSHAVLLGGAGSGKNELAQVFARLIEPTGGKVTIGGRDLARLPESVTGRRIGYVGAHAYLHNATIGENLVYGLKHRPVAGAPGLPPEALDARAEKLAEALKAGNSAFDYGADWIDYRAAGVDGPNALCGRIIEMLRVVDLDEEVYRMGLRGCIDPAEYPETAGKILAARQAMRARLADPAVACLVEPFDAARYNCNATMGENLLFGMPLDGRIDMERLAQHPYLRSVLDGIGLTADLVEIGRRIAETMIELFAELPPTHAFFQQYSFIAAEDLPHYRAILDEAAAGGTLAQPDRERLLSLAFRLIEARHRLGLIDEAMQQSILAARRAFAESLPPSLAGAVAFFDAARYNPAASIQDNILFGKIAHGQAYGEQKVTALIGEVIDGLELRDTVLAVGLRTEVGIGGSRLSIAQRQKLAIGRTLLKRPDLLILDAATESIDLQSQARLIDNVLAECRGRALVWVMNRPVGADRFDQIVVMREGRVAEQGGFDRLASPDGALTKLLEVA